MSEYRFRDDFPFTPEWYETREHAPHLDQGAHQERLKVASLMTVDFLMTQHRILRSVVDLGCGDGGLLSLVRPRVPDTIQLWGYDLQQTNVEHARAGIDVRFGDFLTEDIDWADIAVCTEVLEHLDDPHGFVRRIGEHTGHLVASSPNGETPENHDGLHMWGWDMDGYAELVEQAGFTVIKQVAAGPFQVLMAVQ